MPAKSRQQYKFMKAVEGGYIHPKGLSPDTAKEFTEGMTKKRFAKLKEKVGKKSS